MKKLLFLLIILLVATLSFAEKKGHLYLSPTLGYHFFDNDQELDDKIEGGLRLGYFVQDGLSIEGEADYTNTDHDDAGSTDVTSLSIQAVKFFDFSPKIKPYVFLGAGGLFHEDDMASLVAGIGARYIANDSISLDIRLKDMLHAIDARNDIIPSISLNYHFGKSAPSTLDSAAPEKSEKTEATVSDKNDTPMATAQTTAIPKEESQNKPLDTDNDGVYDHMDNCPETPKGTPVNAMGCTPDTDKDGIADHVDSCPGTPVGLAVNEVGCSADSDQDGVFDYEDKCPNTIQGVNVNPQGCFISATLNIQFETNSAVIQKDYIEKIKEFSDFMKSNPGFAIEIQGHTDDKGSAVYNKQLSQKRADAVMKMLSSQYGISTNRLSAVGYGEEQPIVPNDSPENMQKNRRIATVLK